MERLAEAATTITSASEEVHMASTSVPQRHENDNSCVSVCDDFWEKYATGRRYGYGYGYGQGYISPSNYMEIQPLGLTSRGYTNTEYISVIQNRAPFTKVTHIR
ncbi:hypothetical protein E2542_SST04505 [Spatholobus suberectus]|nr:hypothetical protein E2542_SST04505 [Spatholobus suberectus]